MVKKMINVLIGENGVGKTHSFEYSPSHKGIFNYDKWLELDIRSVFIPATTPRQGQHTT